MPIEIRITGEPEEIAQLLRSLGDRSPLRAVLEQAIHNAAAAPGADVADDPPETSQVQPHDDRLELPLGPPNEWKPQALRSLLLGLAEVDPTSPKNTVVVFTAMGLPRLYDIPQNRHDEFVRALAEKSPPLWAAIKRAPWGRDFAKPKGAR